MSRAKNSKNKKRANGTVVEKEIGYKTKKIVSLSAKTENQKKLFKSIKNNIITIATGPAGTGKTKISVICALESFLKCKYGKIIFTRPCIEADGENLGFLPGDLNEKISPYMLPIFDFLSDYLENSQIEHLIEENKIITLPLAFMRGCTFQNAFVLLDEAQNTTPKQMRMFLTRIGQNTKVVMTGDPNQSDIRGTNGLVDIVTRLDNLSDIGIVRFNKEDIVRHDIVKVIEERYDGV